MANICTFNMRIRGEKASCLELIENGLRGIYEAYIVGESGTDADCLMEIEGECRWNVTNSMVRDKEDGLSLIEQSKKLALEIEVFGYDISEPEWIEHYHYNNGEILREYNLLPYVFEDTVEEMDIEIDLSKYNYKEEHGIYVLNPEYKEDYTWDEDEERMIYTFTMPEVVEEAQLENEGPRFYTISDCPEEMDILVKLFSKYDNEQLFLAFRNSTLCSSIGILKHRKFDTMNPQLAANLMLEYYLDEGGFVIMGWRKPYQRDLKIFEAFAKKDVRAFVKDYTNWKKIYTLKEDDKGLIIAKYKSSTPEVVIPDTIDGKPVYQIGKMAFKGQPIKEVIIPNSVESIGERAFFGCKELTVVTIGNENVQIGEKAFDGCEKLADK